MSQLTSRYFRQTYYGGGYQIVMNFFAHPPSTSHNDNYQVAANHTENHYNSLKGNVNRKGISQRKACFLIFFFKFILLLLQKVGELKDLKANVNLTTSHLFFLYTFTST